jgi:hypothetical protein
MAHSNSARPLADVPAHLTTTLLEVISTCWQRGWQPDDLARVVARTLEAVHSRLLALAVLAEVERYPPGTLDPRWEAQLGRLRAQSTAAWSPSPDLLAAAARTLIGHVSVLPTLRPVGALPGEYPAGLAPQVDQRLLARVRAMLAKAESTIHPAEADTFTAAAQELMARHSIDQVLLTQRSPGPASPDRPGARRIGIDNPYEAAKAALLDRVARANRCRSVWSRALGFGTVVGFDADLDAVETLFTSLLVQATTAMTRAGAQVGRARTRAFRRSFLAAYAVRIGERLTEITRAQAAGSAATLLPVLASRGEEVDEAVAELFPELSEYDVGAVTDAEGYASGTWAADQAGLTTAPPLPEHP